MSNSVIGALRVTLGIDSAAFQKGLTGAQKTLRKFDRDMQKMAAGFKSVGQSLTVGLTLPIVAFGAASLKAAQESADAFGQVEAALKSMGGASGKTMVELQASAKALQNMAAIDDDEILRNVTANLLTFGKVAGPSFDRAQVAIVDLATRLKMELQPATILVGKALNDPIKGLTAMSRAGIQFTEAQKATIKSMVAMGNVAGAQGIILTELERQFGGAAKAAANANPYQKLKVAFGELSETVGAKLLPVILPLINGLTGLLQRFDGLSPAMQKFALIGAAIAAAIGPALIGIGMLLSALGSIAAFMAGPTFALIAAAFWPVTLAVAAVVGVFLLFRKEIEAGLERVKAVIEGAFGPKLAAMVAAFGELWQALKPAIQPIMDAFAGAWSANVGAFGETVSRVFDAIVFLITGAIDGITLVMKAFTAALKGDWSAAFGFLWQGVKNFASTIVNVFSALFPEVVAWVKKTWEGVKLWLVDKFTTIVKAVGEKVKAVAGFFKALWDAVVGHSYVPDMVDGIRDEFARLGHVMVKPALAATEQVRAAYANMSAEVARSMGMNGPTFAQLGKNGAAPDPITAAANDHSGVGSTKMASWGGTVFAPAELDSLREQFVGFGKGFVGAIKDGNLGDYFKELAARFADKLLDRALNGLFDALGSAGGSSGGGSGWIGTALSAVFGGKIPGFATGGSFTVGGSGGVDSQLAMFRATPGEMVNVSHGNDNGGSRGGEIKVHVEPSPYFDVRVEQISAQGDAQVLGHVARAQGQRDQAAKYRVARGGR